MRPILGARALITREDSCEVFGWKIIQCKIKGKSHERLGTPCQDFTEVGIPSYVTFNESESASVVCPSSLSPSEITGSFQDPLENTGTFHDTSEIAHNTSENNPDKSIVLMQADGAGSCKLSDTGAKIACDAMISQLSNRKYSKEMIDGVQAELRREAIHNNTEYKDYSSTLAGIHIIDDFMDDSGNTHTKFTAFQLGDSVMGVWLDKDSSYIQKASLNDSETDYLQSLIEYSKHAENSSEGFIKTFEEVDRIHTEDKTSGPKRSSIWGLFTEAFRTNSEKGKSEDIQDEYSVYGEDGGSRGPRRESKEEVVVVMPPENGEYVNETWMTTSQEASSHLRDVTYDLDNVQGFVLMSDGTASSLYDKKSQRFAPALLKIFKMIEDSSLKDGDDSIKGILKDYISKNTMDDCSILIAVREREID